MSTVDDLDATIKGCRTGAWRLALGSLGLVAALSWQPLTLMLDTLLRWINFSMGLTRVALIACAAGSCVMITTVASERTPRHHSKGCYCAVQRCGDHRRREFGDLLRCRSAK